MASNPPTPVRHCRGGGGGRRRRRRRRSSCSAIVLFWYCLVLCQRSLRGFTILRPIIIRRQQHQRTNTLIRSSDSASRGRGRLAMKGFSSTTRESGGATTNKQGGGGMGVPSSSSKNGNKRKSSDKNKTKNNNTSTSSSSTTTTTTTPFDVAASLLRLEKKYDQILLGESKRIRSSTVDDDDYGLDNNDDDSTTNIPTEYVIATRDGTILPDWVPVAQLVVIGNTQGGGIQHHTSSAVSLYCREIHHVAGLASNTFRSIPRTHLKYAIEPAESFYKFVYDKVVDSSSSTTMSSMTMAEARKVLHMDHTSGSSSGGGTLRELKLQYRKRSFECHPDRVRHKDDVGREESAHEYAQVQLAYDTLLGSGSMRKEGKTWYESLGGRERSDFKTVELLSLKQAEQQMLGVDSAIVGLDPMLVHSFVARSRASKQQQ